MRLYVYLVVRIAKKEIIVTAGGKNVVPALLEDQIRADALVSQVLVVGDNRPFIGALVTLDEEALPGWLGRHGLPASTPLAEAAVNPAVKAAVQELINHANQSVSQAEAIKSSWFCIFYFVSWSCYRRRAPRTAPWRWSSWCHCGCGRGR